MAIECGKSCFLKGKDCKDIRDCMCSCGPLKAINPNLYDGCVDACGSSKASDRPKDHIDYKCNMVGAEALYHFNGGYLDSDCGYDSAYDTNQFCLINPEHEACEDNTDVVLDEDEGGLNLTYLMYGLLALIGVSFLFVLKK